MGDSYIKIGVLKLNLMLKHNNPNIQGNIGIGIAIGYFTAKKYIVSIPLTDSQDYDLIVDMDGLKKIQVKTVYHKTNEIFRVELRTKTSFRGKGVHRPVKTIGDVDFLFILTDDKTKYLIPRDKIYQKRGLSLSSKWDIYII